MVSQDFSGQNRAQGLGFTTFGFWILASIEPWELWFRLLSSLFELMCLGSWALGSEFEVCGLRMGRGVFLKFGFLFD